MQPFREHSGLVAPLDRANVDTDQIIPKQFLKRIERTGFGKFLFYDWRYDEQGIARPDFVLNQPQYAGASILVAGRNFGCGSSREHAPWALADFGFRAIIAPSFADIFANNCVKNGLLAARITEDVATHVLEVARREHGYRLLIDLERRRLQDGTGWSARFEIDDISRDYLLKGLDEIGLTLEHEADIDAFEQRRHAEQHRFRGVAAP